MKLLKNRISGDWGLFCYKEVHFDWHKEVRSASNEKQEAREKFYDKIGQEKEQLSKWVETESTKQNIDKLKDQIQYTFEGRKLIAQQLADYFGETQDSWAVKHHKKTFAVLDMITEKYPWPKYPINVDNPDTLNGKTLIFLGKDIKIVELGTGKEVEEGKYTPTYSRKKKKTNVSGTVNYTRKGKKNEVYVNNDWNEDLEEKGPKGGKKEKNSKVELYKNGKKENPYKINVETGDLTPNIDRHNEYVEKNIPKLKEVVSKYEKNVKAGDAPFDALQKALNETPQYTLAEEDIDFLIEEYRRSLVASKNKEVTAESFAKRNAELVKVAQLAIEARQLKVELNNEDIVSAKTALNILKKRYEEGSEKTVNEADFADIKRKRKRRKAIEAANEALKLKGDAREAKLQEYQTLIDQKLAVNAKENAIIDAMITINDVKNKKEKLYFPSINPKEITFADVKVGSELLKKVKSIRDKVGGTTRGVLNLDILTSLENEIEKKQMIQDFREKVTKFNPETSTDEERDEIVRIRKQLDEKGVADTEIGKGLDKDVLHEFANEVAEKGIKQQVEDTKKDIAETLSDLKSLTFIELIYKEKEVQNVLDDVESVGKDRFTEAEQKSVEEAELIYKKMRAFQSLTRLYEVYPEALKEKSFVDHVDLALYPDANRKMGRIRQDVSNVLRELYGDQAATKSKVVFEKFDTETQKEMKGEFETLYKDNSYEDFFEKMKVVEQNLKLLESEVKLQKELINIEKLR